MFVSCLSVPPARIQTVSRRDICSHSTVACLRQERSHRIVPCGTTDTYHNTKSIPATHLKYTEKPVVKL